MAWFPISHTVPQYVDTNGDPYSGAVLKPYSAGTSTAINFATGSDGDTTVGSIALNAAGFPEVSGNIVIPYVQEKYKLALYPTQAAADANTGAIWNPDAIPITQDFAGTTRTITSTTALDSSDANTHIRASGTITLNLPDIDSVGAGFVFTIRNDGTNDVTLDPNGSEQINGAATLVLGKKQSALVISGVTSWSALVSLDPAQLATDYATAAQGALAGFSKNRPILSNNTTDSDHDIDISAGGILSSDETTSLVLSSALTKQIDATWAAGNNAGGLFSGTVANDTWYHVFLIKKDSDGSIDAGFDTSVTAANIPAGYTAYRRIASILTDGSANIVQFIQVDNRFIYDVPIIDVAQTSPGDTAVLATLSTPPGREVLAINVVSLEDTSPDANSFVIITSPDQTDTAPSTSAFTAFIVLQGSDIASNVIAETLTNTSSQIRYHVEGSTAQHTLRIITNGWIDPTI